jgi:hypothetical protein
MKNWKLRAALAIIGLVIGLAYIFTPRAPRISGHNARRIAAGMTRRKVERILGPAGDYRSTPRAETSSGSSPSATKSDWERRSASGGGVWHSDTTFIAVGFDASNRVIFVEAESLDAPEPPPGKFERFLRYYWKRYVHDEDALD